MERKLVKQGPATLMVSLPAKWVHQKELKKGSSVFIEETPTSLQIYPEKKQQTKKRITLDITKLNPLVNRMIRAHYTQGVDEILITFTDQKQIEDVLTRAIPELLGYAVIEQTNTSILIRDVSTQNADEFDAMLRRIFLLIDLMGKTMQEALTKQASFESVSSLDQNVNRSVNFCLRLYAKGYKEQDPKTYTAIVLLEMIGDLYKELGENFKSQNKSGVDAKELSNLLHDVKEYFAALHCLWFKFRVEDAVSLAKKYQVMEKKFLLHKSTKKQIKTVDTFILLEKLVNLMVTLSGLMLAKS